MRVQCPYLLMGVQTAFTLRKYLQKRNSQSKSVPSESEAVVVVFTF